MMPSSSQEEIPPPPPPPPSSQTPTQQTPHTVSTIKLPILKKGEYDIWAMKMEHYLAHTDYPIWEVIQNGNGPVSITTDTSRQIKVLPPRTTEEIVAREKERKARTTLLMAIPEDHLAKFHKMTDAKEMWDAIKSRFGGNDESKKTQKYILKQQFEGFSVSNTEGLHKGYDRFQSLLSQLEIHRAGVSTEDANQKFLRSLPSAWAFLARECRIKGTQDNRRRDAWNSGNKDRSRTVQKEDSKALVRVDGEGVDWTNHSEDEDYAYGLQHLFPRPFRHKSVFMNKESDIENQPVYDRFTEGMHAVHPPMTGNYIPSGPEIEIDYSQFTYGPKQTQPRESESQSSDSDTCDSNSSTEPSELVSEPMVNESNVNCQSKDNPHRTLKNKGIIDSGCSRHMTGNKAYLADFQDFNGGPVAFGGSKGYITGKGKIKTGKLDFEDVSFVKELQHFNLFSVSQMCDKKNKVLFTDSECLVLSPDFKLPDENQILLKVPRQNNMYSFNLENIVPLGGLACLIAKATTDESNLWHRRLGHVNFKNLNRLVKGNLVRGLPTKLFQNDHTCVACQKGKQHKASCKAKSKEEFSKKHRVTKEFVSKTRRKLQKGESSVQRDPLFDVMPEDKIDHMETENAQSERRTRKLMDEDKELMKDDLVLKMELVDQRKSTEEHNEGTEEIFEGTEEQREGTEDQTKEEIATKASQTSTQTPTSMTFGDDETIATLLLNMSKAKAASKEKEKGVETTGRRSLKRGESKSEDDDIPQAVKKFKQLESDEELARKIQEEWEAEEERNKIAEEKATNEALIKNFDDIKARIEADIILAEKLQEQEREQFTIEERAKFLHDTIAAQRKFLARQRLEPSETDLQPRIN
ncbi:ribonuclease H-like domain-containing protein [Tanacetum coccineum]